MKKIILVIIIIGLLFSFGCTKPDDAKRVLKAQGYTSIEITGWAPFSKGEDDWYSTGFKAIAPNGAKVKGVVTSGLLFKGSTVRIK